jgi:hypothetical protein
MGRDAGYRYEATSVEGFVQQLAVSYIKNHYWFYVMGHIREGRDPRPIDAAIIGKYGIAMSKASRYRRKRAGTANLQYLRFRDTYLILATHGVHAFHTAEKGAIRDAREVPIKFHGYAVSYRGGHAHVRIEQGRYKELKAYFREIAPRRSASTLAAELRALPWDAYAPVRGQYFGLLREINRSRKAAGRAPVPDTAVRRRRKVVRPFEPAPGRDPIGHPAGAGPGGSPGRDAGTPEGGPTVLPPS